MFALWLSCQLKAQFLNWEIPFIFDKLRVFSNKMAGVSILPFTYGTVVSLTCGLLVFDYLGRTGYLSLRLAFICSTIFQYVCTVWAVGHLWNVLCSWSAVVVCLYAVLGHIKAVHIIRWSSLVKCWVNGPVCCFFVSCRFVCALVELSARSSHRYGILIRKFPLFSIFFSK